VSDYVSYELSDGVATLTMDDGAVNAMSIPMLSALHAAFDRAQRDDAVVLLSGRDKIFSAGFDLKVIRSGDIDQMREMLLLGATMAERILAWPRPVVVASPGHAFPAGAFLMLAADRRIGSEGMFRTGLNEVAIGLTLPKFAVELARYRLTPAYFNRATTGDMYAPQEAVAAGFLDELVAPEGLAKRSREVALGLTKIDMPSHYGTKMLIRAPAIAALRHAIESELEA